MFSSTRTRTTSISQPFSRTTLVSRHQIYWCE